MKETTSELVRNLWTHMSKTYGSSVVYKPDAAAMQVVGSALDLLGIVDKAAFMTQYATTIGNTIYTPFEPGVAQGVWPLWQQVLTCVHEHQHVIQAAEIGMAAYMVNYLGNTSERAAYEASAYRTEMALDFWQSGTLRPVTYYSGLMKAYNLPEEDVKFFEVFLYGSLDTLKMGKMPDEAARVAVKWLESA